MMHVGTSAAVVCLDAVRDTARRRELVSLLEQCGKEMVEISPAQMASFAGNMLELKGSRSNVLAIFSASIATHPGKDWWWSLSATYYQTPAIVGVLVPACIVLISHIGYNTADNLITSIAGISGLGIVLFPCKVSWIADGTPVGFFQVPIEISHYIHAGCAALFFFTIAINSIYQFTKSRNTMTERKKLRNKVYRFCGYGMLLLEAIFLVTRITPCPAIGQ